MNTHAENTQKTSRSGTELLSELSALRDTAKVRLHLLSLDARQTFGELEARLGVLEHRVQGQGERVTESVLNKATELAQTITALLDGASTPPPQPSHGVRWLMQDAVQTCTPEASLAEVARILWEQDCGVVPVATDGGKVVGMITDRDVCMAVYTQGKTADRISVSTAMSRRIFSCSPEDTIFQALETIGSQRVRRLPVLNEEGRLLGIVSLSDIARYVKSLNDSKATGALLEAFDKLTQRRSALQAAAE